MALMYRGPDVQASEPSAMSEADQKDAGRPLGAIRLFVESPLAADTTATLTPGQAHYLRHVMRRGPDDRIRLFNGRDGEWDGLIETLGRNSGAVRLTTRLAEQRAAPDLWLMFAPLKSTRTRFVVEKATEMGAAALLPVLTHFGQTRRINDERLRAHAVEAAEQCGRHDVPNIAALRPLDEVLADWPDERRLLACDPESAEPIAGALPPDRRGSWAILIGPEGGFEPDERRRLTDHPAVVRASLGPRILRAETAVVAALACWQVLAGDWEARHEPAAHPPCP
jgi:16S rRNA (uracil1498-N3)-methyltransferase